MSNFCRLDSRLPVAVLAILLLGYGSLWAYVEYAAHRAKSMLAELDRLKIGDTESSVVALTRSYGGIKWTPAPLPPKEDWVDKEEYSYEVTRQSDYEYELWASPIWSTVARVGRLGPASRSAREVIPERLRPLLGLRDWGVVAELSIRSGRLRSVSVMALFEGHSGWLGHKWYLADSMPRYDMPVRAYAIGASHLTMANGGGEMIVNFYTPQASGVEVNAAREFNFKCLAGAFGCHNFCDAAPLPIQYLAQHPDASWNIIPPQCN